MAGGRLVQLADFANDLRFGLTAELGNNLLVAVAGIDGAVTDSFVHQVNAGGSHQFE